MGNSKIIDNIVQGKLGTNYAFRIALLGSVLLTLVSAIANISEDWKLDDDFHIIFNIFVNFLLIFIVALFLFRIMRFNMPKGWKITSAIIGTIVLVVVMSALSGWMHTLIYDDTRFSVSSDVNIVRDVTVAAFAIMAVLTIHNFTRRLQYRVEREKILTENAVVRYEALENQLDPHFLFNSLNTLSGLIGNDDEKAQTYLQQLASTYRYIIQGKKLVALSEEIDFARSYSEMMLIRYGDNLRFVMKVNSDLMGYQIIPISIQLLIENAIKHNVVSNRHPLTITLETTSHATFRVSNPVHAKQDESNSVGIGLANLSKRYQLLCQRDISISDNDDIFTVEVPIFTPEESKNILDSLKK